MIPNLPLSEPLILLHSYLLFPSRESKHQLSIFVGASRCVDDVVTQAEREVKTRLCSA